MDRFRRHIRTHCSVSVPSFLPLVFLSLAAFGCSIHQSDGGPPISVPKSPAQALAEELGAKLPGVQVAVWQAGSLVDHGEAGFSDVASKAPVKQSTAFPVFSASKAWTATLLAQLAQARKIDPNGALSPALVPGWKSKQWPVTPMQLATHRGGIRHYRDNAEAEIPRRCETVAQALPIFIDDPLEYEPDTEQRYSSWGFVLLSAVIETAAGEDFDDLLKAKILEPSSMESTAAAARGRSDSIATSYETEGDRFSAIDLDPSCKWGAGGYYASATDLVRFYGALKSGSLVNEQFAQLVANPSASGTIRFGGRSLGGMSQVVGDWSKGSFVAVVANARVEDLDLAASAAKLLVQSEDSLDP